LSGEKLANVNVIRTSQDFRSNITEII
jgi:hypothetical protein